MAKGQKFFYEKYLPFDEVGMKLGFPLKKHLYSGRSPYQQIDVVELKFYGPTLFLDKILQTTSRDEFIYHEMLCQTPLFLHKAPQKVLIIGGGDGGALEEVLKHKTVKEAWMVEIDKKVIEVSQTYLPSISKGAFRDKRSRILIEDGQKFIKHHQSIFDVIILDISDPHGSARNLTSERFYRRVKNALSKEGIVSIQSGSFTAQPKLIPLIYKRLKKVFRFVEIYTAVVPSYQVGLYTFTMASDFSFPKVSQSVLKKKFRKAGRMKLKYWSPDIHWASSILPTYLKQELK